MYDSYLQATQKVLFHDAVLMQLAARFTGNAACAMDGGDNDEEAALDAAEEDQDDEANLGNPGNDPATLRARDLFLAALAREKSDIGELKEKMAVAKSSRRKQDKHDDRNLRPSQQMMRQWGLTAPALYN